MNKYKTKWLKFKEKMKEVAQRRRTKQDIKAARLTAIMVGVVFYACYLPVLVIRTIFDIFEESVTILQAFIWAWAFIWLIQCLILLCMCGR